ncbi:MAG: ketosteroid isomerase-like protein [Marmoricola sp.]|nr:ketosteroid isomerase-like protein [Marmoricola sp.]
MNDNVTHERRQSMQSLFAAVDAMNVDGLLSFLAPDGTQTFGNMEPLRGHEQIREANEAFFGTIDSMAHEIVSLWEWDGTIVAQLKATYVRKDGRAVTVPAVTILKESDGKIVDYQVYVDQSPVFAP